MKSILLATLFMTASLSAQAKVLNCAPEAGINNAPEINSVRFNPETGYINFNLIASPADENPTSVVSFLRKVSETIYEKELNEVTLLTVYSLGDSRFELNYSEISADGDFSLVATVRCK